MASSPRLLRKDDFDKGFFELLSQLTRAPKPSREEFEQVFEEEAASRDCVFVIESDGVLIGSCKLCVERKFHNAMTMMGHIEDVVVHESHRRLGLGILLINYATDTAFEKNCYKVVLDCAQKNVSFYESCGYQVHGTEMTKYKDVF